MKTEVKNEAGTVVGTISSQSWSYRGETSTNFFAVAFGRFGTRSQWNHNRELAERFIQDEAAK